jgi:uncharacterized protein (TIGR03435 family)
VIDVANWLMVYIVNSVWQIPLLAACTAALLRIVARADGKAQFHLWVGCLVICIALPALSSMSPLPQLTVYPSELKVAPTQSETKQVVEAESPMLTYAAKVTQPAREEGLGQFLLCLYALSLLVGTFRFLWKLKLTRDIVIRVSRLTLSPSAANSLLRAATALGIAPVEVYSSPSVRCPAAVRWPRPMLIVPADFSRVPENDAVAAIAHELAHIRRHDFEVNLVYEVLSVFAFYHPAMHWIKRRIADTREVVCDAIAADVTTGRTAYARSLLNFAKTVSKPATEDLLLGVLSSTTLEKRITKLIDVPLPLTRTYRLLSAACCWMMLTASSVGALALSIRFPAAQARNEDAQIPRFDEVLVKPNRTEVGRVTVEFPEEGDKITIKNIPLQWIIENAYDMPFENRQLTEVPDWTKWARYDIQGKIADSDLVTYRKLNEQQRWLMLQPILADYFKLKVRRRAEEVPAYALVVAENGPKMNEVKPGDPPPNRAKWPEGASHFPFPGKLFETGDRHQAAGQMPMSSLARGLLGRVDGRQIVDKTGLKGTYNFMFRWTPPQQPPQASSLSMALQEYLGLKLEPTKVTVVSIVIDHVEKPSESVAHVVGQTAAAESGRRVQPLFAHILSDTQGADFAPYMRQALQMIGKSWSSSSLRDVPDNFKSETTIRFTISPNGTIHNMVLADSAHLIEIDRAAWGSITSVGRFPSLPAEFKGPNLVLDVGFKVNSAP